MTYRLTRRCEQDIIRIHRHDGPAFGVSKIAPERNIAKRRVRLHPYRAHVIIYRESEDSILIIRVLHVRQDWRRHRR